MRLRLSLVFAACLITGCTALRPLPSIDLSAAGWVVHQGRATWRRPSLDSPVLVGDLVFATHPTQGRYLRFSKIIPVVNARWVPNYGWNPGQWEIEFSSENRRLTGRGSPPKWIAWSHWLEGVENHELPAPWLFTPMPADSGVSEDSRWFKWSKHFTPSAYGGILLDTDTGERLEIEFQP